jgi:hypothetical protein
MELIGQLPGAVCNWEPFHPSRGVLPRSWDMGWRPFVPENEPDPRLEAWFDDLFRFRIGNHWTLSHVTRETAAAAEIGVHKFVRASLLMPWMVTHLRLDRRPVFLVRHPFATISSQDTNFEGVRASEPAIVERRFADEYASIVTEQTDPALMLFATWCYRNRPALDHGRISERLIVVHYENLILEPEDTLRSVLDQLAWPAGVGAANSVDFGRASRSDFLAGLAEDRSVQLVKWLDRIDPGLLEPAQELLDRFGITCYRADEVMPT